MGSQNVDPTWVNNMIDGIYGIVTILLPVIVTLGLVVFFIGTIKFITAAGDVKARQNAKGFLVLGVVVLFVMVSVWGIVEVLGQLFGVPQGGTGFLPGVTGIDPIQ